MTDQTIEPITSEEPIAPDETQVVTAEPMHVMLVAAASFLAAAGAGWAAGGLFRGALARIVAMFAAVLGAGIIALAFRSRRPLFWQAAAIPGIGVVGVVFALLGGAPGGVVEAISNAIRGGGPSGAAMPFEAGWRFVLFVLVAMLAAGSCALGVTLRRPRLSVLLSVPPLVGTAIVQPKGATLTSGLPAMGLLLAALVVSYGGELQDRGASSRRFESRRIFRGIIAIAMVAVVLTGISRAGVLFPIPDRERVIPPQLPPAGVTLPDRVLFTVSSSLTGPWRIGVLDVYDGTAWRLPPFDPARLQHLPADGRLPGTTDPNPRDVKATVTMMSLPGPVLPTVGGSRSIRTPAVIDATYDPRTQMLRSPSGPAPAGTSYEITAAPAPNGGQLAAAEAAKGMDEYLFVPAAPPEVVALLEKAPKAPLWDRLQFVRAAYYTKIVAAGAGRPLAVPPARVARMLAGDPASPYEISAAEALLARWAGVPSRIGYGFFEGDKKAGVWSVHPRHAATWLETYFEGHGWVPIVGVPPRAKASLNQEQKKSNPIVRPTEQLALVLYVPVRLRTLNLFYTVARYWITVTLPFVMLAILSLVFYPSLLKVARRLRRILWARRAGLDARIAIAYAELRDAATDLNVADTALTPVEFADAVASDDEHTELSWLVSRALWGDLRRDLRLEDAEIAERMASSVRRRLRRAQTAPTRIIALASRASLREPYTREVPNLWPAKRIRLHPIRRLLRIIRLRRLVPIGAALTLLLSACAAQPPKVPLSAGVLPAEIVPNGLDDISFQRESAVEARLVDAGRNALISTVRVFTFRNAEAVQGYLQVGSFVPGISGIRPEVRRGVIAGIGSARFKLTRVGLLRVYVATVGQQDFALWFAPEGSYFELLVSRKAFTSPLDLFAKILAHQGRRVDALAGPVVEPPDPRRGEAI